jgi:myo-inositol catabolism protein IolC
MYLQNLRVYAPGLPDQVAMKAVALRDQDLDDLELLLPRMTETDSATLVSVIEHLAGIRPDWASRLRYFLLEQGWEIE